MLASRPVPPILEPKRISGRDNPEFRRFQAVRARKDEGVFLVEGPKQIAEAVRSNLAIEAVAVEDEAALAAVLRVLDARATRLVRFAAPLMRALAEVETPQGLLAIVARPKAAAGWLAAANAFILILDGVQDPGNVGTLIRTAEAAGVSGVLLTRGCADPLSSKSLRASAGSALRLPFLSDLDPSAVLALLPGGLDVVATVAGEGADSFFSETLPRLPLALALGSEGRGLSARLEAAATVRLRIPAAREVESLNVAVAGGVAMFEIARRAGILAN
jgi:TrmH family RNA methyltransferase